MKYLLSNLSSVFSKTSKNTNSSSSTAFSLIEVSIVLMLIGILVAATISAKVLIKNSRIATAQSKTRSSPVNSIPNSVIWLESSLETSFADEEAEDGTDLNSWNDIKSGSASPTNNGSAGSTNPIYSNTINSIQAVRFSGNANSYFEIDGSALNNSDYTIIVLEKRQGTGANYFLSDDGTSTDDNETIQLGYSASGAAKHSQGSGNEYTAAVESYSSSSESPKIFTFIQNSSTGKKTYVNGFLSAENASDTTQLYGINKLHLGKNYTGEIGEFLIFDRALKNEERRSIETYLTEKWRMKNIVTSSTDESCTSGTVSSSGCQVASCNYTVYGAVAATGSVSGASGTIACGTSNNFAGTDYSYTCSSGSDINANCACASGYTYSSSTNVCETSCDYTVYGATTPTGSVSDASGTISCGTADNFAGTDYAYTCSGGVDISSNCDCASGFEYDSSSNTCKIGAIASYSVRKIVSSYSGNALQLRKNGSSPGTQDFGFDSNGDLDTSAIATWLGSDNAWVTKFYDQSGSGYDFVQNTTSRQARYAENFGSNSKPTLDCTGIACTYVISTNVTAFDFTDNFSFGFALATSNATGHGYLWTKNNSKNIEISLENSSGFRLRNANNVLITPSASFSSNQTMVSQLTFDKNASSQQLKYYTDGSLTEQGTKTTSFSVGSGATYLLSNLGINNEWRGKISEVVIHDATLSNSERSDQESSMSSYYGI